MAYKDLTNDEKIAFNTEVKKFIRELDTIKLDIENAAQKTDDYSEVDLDRIILEDGDGKPATIGHINALAKRLLALEKATGLLTVSKADAIAKLKSAYEKAPQPIPKA